MSGRAEGGTADRSASADNRPHSSTPTTPRPGHQIPAFINGAAASGFSAPDNIASA